MTGLAGGPPHLGGVERDDRTFDDVPAAQQDAAAGDGDGDGDVPYYSYAPTVDDYDHEYDERKLTALVGGVILLALLVASIVVGFIAITNVPDDENAPQAQARPDVPPYWTVRRGDTFASIAERTGLEIEDLETFNPRVDPAGLVPGQRLQLVANPPKPKPKPLGPRFVKVRAGDTFSSIAAKWGHSVDRLRRLNPKLKPETLQPGVRMRLR